jgi:adenylate kinase family enzyme
MERIAILGCGGSGKTHLARELAHRLDLPLTHLDAVYYDADWNPMPRDDFAQAQRRLVTRPRWVIEGNYASTLPVRLEAADTVIVMDLPARTCLRGIAQRWIRHRGGQNQDTGVYDRITWDFIRYVLSYRRTMLPRVHQLVGDHAPTAEVIILRSRPQARRFLKGVTPQPGPGIVPAANRLP